MLSTITNVSKRKLAGNTFSKLLAYCIEVLEKVW